MTDPTKHKKLGPKYPDKRQRRALWRRVKATRAAIREAII